ncbi:NAD-P-binding protein [Calocera viscosa TUFC12733]|uniref:NAD-P-binding protein n=1 Tax=Calocera viscosa (strain TUFC12733) TaxID=1330018 RepID=A0A167S164_CALVF|nr:NAD-P-binding protein [Calocera viscosa TUFC12733]
MSAIASPAVVLITGGNGFVGTATVLELIKQGYKVKAIIRSQAKADAFIHQYPVQSSSIEWVIVTDLTNDEAMNTAAADVDYVIHVATPFSFTFTDNVNTILKPARDMTLATLKAAANHPRIKRVVITSSFIAVWDLLKDNGLWPGKTFTADDWNPATWDQAASSPNPYYVMAASKTIAEQAAHEFVAQEKPAFALTTFCPPIMFGPPLQAELSTNRLNPANGIIWGILSGRAKELPETKMPIFVDVRDFAYLQVAALTNEKAKNQRYLAISGHWYAEQLVDIVKEAFPEQASRLPPTVRTKGPEHFEFDVSKTERDFNIKWIPLKKSIVDMAKVLYDKEKQEKAGKV